MNMVQAAYWAAAAGTAPEPALRLPLAPAVALIRGTRRLAPYALSRAVAAAQRREAVKPSWCLPPPPLVIPTSTLPEVDHPDR